MVLVHAEPHVLGAGGEPGELLQRPRGDDRIEVGAGCLERGLLYREPIRVRRGHDQLVALELDEDAR